MCAHACGYDGSDVLNFIEDNAAGLIDLIQAHAGSQNSEQAQQLPVRPRQAENVIVPYPFRGVAYRLGLLLLPAIGRRGT